MAVAVDTFFGNLIISGDSSQLCLVSWHDSCISFFQEVMRVALLRTEL